ncbi:MAG: DNA replication and repair protein RecF [Lentisphaerae bacterium]|nr:DNA replication and repair protein RecF [Lentisphaerota bacterium]
MGTLSRLQAWDFRNLRQLDLSFGAGMTLLVGRNGQGKSNILEAIGYLGLLRSFRTQTAAELRAWGSPGFALRGEISGDDGGPRLNLAISQSDRRVLQVDGKAVERASAFINSFLCVPLVPEDLELVKGAAAVRRRFIDVSISQGRGQYLADLQSYRSAVSARNMILRRPEQYPGGVLEAYDEQIVRHGTRIEIARREYLADLEVELTALSTALLDSQDEAFSLSYTCPGVTREAASRGDEGVTESLSQALRRSRERDQRDGHTSVGPHRADLAIGLGSRALSAYGSEGECRMACLALRLAALARARRGVGSRRAVVALVDDVLGELDAVRRQAFLTAVGQADQIVMTATECPKELTALAAATYSVRRGEVTPL